MSLLVDLFGYLGILLHGLVIVSQSMALGGMLFLVLLARPYAASLGPEICARTVRIAAWSAVALVCIEVLEVPKRGEREKGLPLTVHGQLQHT